MELWGVFLTGLFVGGASCAAVQGGLLAGMLARRRPDHVGREKGVRSEQSRGEKAGGLRRGDRPAPQLAPHWRETLSQDALPVTGFLAGKLASHTALGGLLGAVGGAVQLSSTTRAVMQVVAGIVMLVLALDLLGLSGWPRLSPQLPAGLQRWARRNAKSEAMLGPGLLGLSTVFIPCGVTLGVEVLAVASGSPLAGAAIMATFVVGTSPLFAVLGYAARRSATALRGQLSKLAAVAVIIMGLVSINTGLALGGSPVTLASVARALSPARVEIARGATGTNPDGSLKPPDGGKGALAPETSPAVRIENGVQLITIDVLSKGYTPRLVTAEAGVPTVLTLRTNNTRGCTTAFVIPSMNYETTLPATGETRVELGQLKAGTLDYTCGMGMYRGKIVTS